MNTEECSFTFHLKNYNSSSILYVSTMLRHGLTTNLKKRLPPVHGLTLTLPDFCFLFFCFFFLMKYFLPRTDQIFARCQRFVKFREVRTLHPLAMGQFLAIYFQGPELLKELLVIGKASQYLTFNFLVNHGYNFLFNYTQPCIYFNYLFIICMTIVPRHSCHRNAAYCVQILQTKRSQLVQGV